MQQAKRDSKHASCYFLRLMLPQNALMTAIPVDARQSMPPHAVHHFFLPLPLPFGVAADRLDATLPALDVCAEVDLLPFLTASSCLFCTH